MPHPGIIARYRAYLRLPPNAAPITLLEGDTPLIPAPRLGAELGCALYLKFEGLNPTGSLKKYRMTMGGTNPRAGGLGAELGCALYLKFEGLNPTGSFKDHGMTMAMTIAVAEGARAVICASTGNTAASAAAYAARAGLRCYVLIPEGKVAAGKLAGAMASGAEVVQIQGSFDDALSLVRQIADQTPLALVNSINPHRLEGQKTAAFGICDGLGRAPDWLCLPVGNAGNITAYWKGFHEYRAANRVDSLPPPLSPRPPPAP